MEVYTEAKLNPNISSSLAKKGITSTTDSIKELNGKNAFVDLSNLQYKEDATYMKKLMDTCEAVSGYDKKIIYIPVSKWRLKDTSEFDRSKTPLGSICRYIKQSPADFKTKFKDFIFVFYNADKESFALYPSEYKSSEYMTFTNLLKTICTSKVNNIPRDIDDAVRKSPVKDVIDHKAEEQKKVERKKHELVDIVADIADSADSEEDAWNTVNNDPQLKDIIAELEEEDNGRPNFNAARTARMDSLDKEFLERDVNGKTVEQIINANTKYKDQIPTYKHMEVASINEEWQEVKFINFQKSYDINSDIFKMLASLANKSYPVSIIDVNVEDTSTNMDFVETYTVKMEDGFGKRFTLTFDIPKFRNNRFMKLRGNEKIMSGQLLLLPCLKTDEGTVQCVTNYNKIFIYRHGLQGRAYPSSDKLIKALKKLEGTNSKIKVFFGDNTAICSKHEVPTDYIDIASNVNRIETEDMIYYFNQDDYYTRFNVEKKDGIIPYSISKFDGSVNYYTIPDPHNIKDIINPISAVIAKELCYRDDTFKTIYNSIKPANRLNYSQASIMSNRIPLAIVIGYSLGLDNMLKLISTDTEYLDKAHNINYDTTGVIRFKDKVITYPITYASSMLLNGLSECATENYTISEANRRAMWLDFLDEYGGRILSDGLDNFVDLFVDPITAEVCEHCKIPSDYFGMLIYANNLLSDNKYNRHTDISGNRYRTVEIVAGYFYKALGESYKDYKAQIKRGRKAEMTMKRSAVIDLIMRDSMMSDLSIMNPLLEIEANNSASFKGLSGMNSDRSYGLDKRTYDDSMINKLALSTGFAANVGINRQTTIDMDIEGNRGYIKQSKDDDMSITKTFSMSEAVTPFGTTRDDPFRSAMTFIQTSKHSMPTKKSMPLLVTNGADEAMAYISSDTFVYRAEADGKVIEVTDEYMIIEYDNTHRSSEYNHACISLKEEIKKNSDGGFYVTIKLDTDLKVGDTFKQEDIIAYNRATYSNKNGETDHLAYNLGVLAKVAILNTDEGFEDSTSVSSWLSDAMTTDVVIEKDKDLSKNTNVYHIAQAGQPIQEGDPLLIFQNAFDEKDANQLLNVITDPEFVSDLGRVKLKSKYTGIVQDVVIYRTCEISEMSESLQKIVTEYEKGIKARKTMYEKYGIPGINTFPPDYKMQPTGIMKNNIDGVKIVFYISYNDKLSVGDKIVAQSANKGVVKNIFPEGQAPFSEFRPNEQIHALFAARSFNARMVTSVWVSGAINKAMIELDRAVKDIMDIPYTPIEDME